MVTIKREEEEREGLISGTSHGGGGNMAVMVVEYLYSSMSRDLLGKFPDNSAFDFDYTQSTIWSPLVPRHFPSSPIFNLSSSTANALQRKLSYDDDDDKMDRVETGGEGGSHGLWENHAEETVVKKLKENIKNRIGTSCGFSHFCQINHRIKTKGIKTKKKHKTLDGFSPAIPSSSGAAKSVYDSTTPRKGWAKVLKAASRHFKKKTIKKKDSTARLLQISSGLTFPPISFY